ncbi:E3 ubiquitin- ligase MARCH2 [Chlorella sorokiniana]|uniref:E3 ubiquitin-ligase MARCH2 n=1 Tax=Chlorella sorokiniana TaxID=3076 RepID=A0A2P6U319_CHLSO|nr:E3 ubiquitin- ligase MARCH2 [Chlorella sorokiniana]|eukprot:PRW60710.1 E3 ubiquitin- ligase MARCH2 [Chlorella sorokiniana]
MLLAPCHCQGTLRFIHQRCLQEWLQHAPPAARLLCSVCHAAYVFPPGFEVPPTDYNQQQVQQQVWQDAEDALAEAEHQEGRWRARQPWPLGLTLLVGGAAVASVAAALLSVQLAKRYRAQQVEEWWQRQRERVRRRYHKWLRESRIPQLEAESAQLERWLQALRTHQRLDRWLPPPLVRGEWKIDRLLTNLELAKRK